MCVSSTELWLGLDTAELHWLCWKKKERGRQSDRNAAGIPRNLPPSLPPLSPITVHESIRSFNMQDNGQGELFCNHNARKRYLSAKNVRTIEAPGPGNNQRGSWGRCPPPVKISYCDVRREGLGVSLSTAAAAAGADDQLNHKSRNCATPQITVQNTTVCIPKYRHSHARKHNCMQEHCLQWQQGLITICKLMHYNTDRCWRKKEKERQNSCKMLSVSAALIQTHVLQSQKDIWWNKICCRTRNYSRKTTF